MRKTEPPDTTAGDRESGGRDRQSEELLDAIELQSAILVRNLEMLRRRGDFYKEVDRAGYLLLRTLERVGPSDVGTLAGLLGLDPSTTGRQLKAVTAAGFTERLQDPADRRRGVFTLTSAGRTAMLAVRHRRRDGTAQMLQHWSTRDLQTLEQIFSRYNAEIARTYITGTRE